MFMFGTKKHFTWGKTAMTNSSLDNHLLQGCCNLIPLVINSWQSFWLLALDLLIVTFCSVKKTKTDYSFMTEIMKKSAQVESYQMSDVSNNFFSMTEPRWKYVLKYIKHACLLFSEKVMFFLIRHVITTVNLQSSHAFVLVISTYCWINSFLLPKALFVVFICNYAPTVR